MASILSAVEELSDILLRNRSLGLGIGGNIYWVSNVGGIGADNSTRGTAPETPFATVGYALTQCATGNNDMIVVMPGHAEDIAAAAAITINKAGINIIGLGNGRNRPTLTWKTSTAAQVIISAANVTISNMVFDFTGIDAVVAGFAVDAADVKFDGCEFLTNAAAAGVVSGITVGTTTTSPRFTVVNSRFLGPATNSGTTTTAQVTITDAPDFVFENNYCTGKMTQSITNGAANLRGLIRNNAFVIATGTKAINMHASSTPFTTNNRINVPSGTAPIVAAAGFVAGNVYSAAAGVTAGTASTI
jgi:hypothetical protein